MLFVCLVGWLVGCCGGGGGGGGVVVCLLCIYSISFHLKFLRFVWCVGRRRVVGRRRRRDDSFIIMI